MSAQSPYAPPKASLEADPGIAEIDSLSVSETWKKRFRAMHKAGGPDLPKLKELSPQDRKDVAMFSVLAFLFGPFYYLAKGMWRKAIVLLLLCLIAILVIDFLMTLGGLGKYTDVTRFISAAVFAALANRDYYSKMVLGQNGWWWSKAPKQP